MGKAIENPYEGKKGMGLALAVDHDLGAQSDALAVLVDDGLGTEIVNIRDSKVTNARDGARLTHFYAFVAARGHHQNGFRSLWDDLRDGA